MDIELLEDLGYHLAVAQPTERRGMLVEMTAKHPHLAAELADFLVELEVDERREPERFEAMVDRDHPAVLLAMERFRVALARYR